MALSLGKMLPSLILCYLEMYLTFIFTIIGGGLGCHPGSSVMKKLFWRASQHLDSKGLRGFPFGKIKAGATNFPSSLQLEDLALH